MRKPHVPFDGVSRKIRHESFAEQHQMTLHLFLGKTDKVDREGVNFAFIDMTTVGENSDKPIEETRIQAAQCELCIGFIGESQFFELGRGPLSIASIQNLRCKVKNLQEVPNFS